MSDLLSMSFDIAASPSIRIRGWDEEDETGPLPTGWGFGWYPTGESGAAVIKDPVPTGDTPLSRVLRDWERFRATVFLCHIRGAAKRASQENTHPFQRSYAGRDWLLAHSGDLDPKAVRALSLGDVPVFEPVGLTDSEHAFCWLLTQIREAGARRLADVGWTQLQSWLSQLNELGSLNILLTDGEDVVAYRDAKGHSDLQYVRRRPPHEETKLNNGVVTIDLGDPLDINRTMVFIATTPTGEGDWKPIENGELMVVRRGAVFWRSHGDVMEQPDSLSANDADREAWTQAGMLQAAGNGSAEVVTPPPAPISQESAVEPQTQIGTSIEPNSGTNMKDVESRILTVSHETTYTYEEAVERSTHVFRLQPVHDLLQDVLEYDCQILPDGESADFEDVFGNQTKRMKLRRPYEELKIVAKTRVRVKRAPSLAPPARRESIPLVWMPWQRQMMEAYLLPPELPETQLRELSQFAMSFVERQDYDLMETLADINRTIRQDFAYVSESTNLETTPFDVYVNRRGVCQDFANLFICLARLLNVPARYRVGYIFTGADYENKIQSEASHAWVELYVPWAGWRGYDPTNGCLANIDHIRVAVGRNYRDATPTSGTIYKGGKGEKLSVTVRVEAEED